MFITIPNTFEMQSILLSKGFKVQQNLAYYDSLNHLKNNVWPCYQYLQFLVIKVNFHYVTGPCGFQHTIALIFKARCTCTLYLTKNISWSFSYCMHCYFCVYVGVFGRDGFFVNIHIAIVECTMIYTSWYNLLVKQFWLWMYNFVIILWCVI